MTLVVQFSEDLFEPSAENIGNYEIDPALAITGAELQSDLRTVHLDVSAIVPGVTYTLSAIGVMDLANTPNSSDDSATFSYTTDPRVTSGLLVLYRFTAGGGSTVFDVSGVGTPMNLSIADPVNTTWIGGGGLALTGPAFVGAASDTKLRSKPHTEQCTDDRSLDTAGQHDAVRSGAYRDVLGRRWRSQLHPWSA